MKFEIKHRYSQVVLFSVEADSLKFAVELAVKSQANLRGADLKEADLREADLEGANLKEADLRGAKGLERFPIQIGGHKHWLITTQDGELQIGCHKKSFEYWQENAERIGELSKYSALDIKIYKLHIAHIQKISQLLWDKEKP